MRLIPTTAITLWTATVAYVPASIRWPAIWPWAPLQRVALGAAVCLTVIWWLDRRSDEFRYGYLRGLKDRYRDRNQ